MLITGGRKATTKKNMQVHLSIMKLSVNIYLPFGNVSRKIRSWMSDIC